MDKKAIVYPSFKSAQALYSNYSTITDNLSLWNHLLKYIDSSFLSALNSENIREIYNKIILKYYPNESCIKAEFLNNILLRGKKHVSIFELPVGSSRVDLCKINGKSFAYEIKSDLDNFTRLSKQLQDYLFIFDYVYVICSENRVYNISDFIPKECGIYTYKITSHGIYHFNLFKKATINTLINSNRQLQLLHKKELLDYFSFDATEYNKNNAIKAILHKYDSIYINKQFKKALKTRYQKQWDFLKTYKDNILEIDYQWFFKNPINPAIIYN